MELAPTPFGCAQCKPRVAGVLKLVSVELLENLAAIWGTAGNGIKQNYGARPTVGRTAERLTEDNRPPFQCDGDTPEAILV